MGLLNTTRTLASLWVDNKKRELEGTGRPETKADSGGSKDRDYFSDQEIDQDALRDIKEIRESGGVIAHLVRAKALMQFGTGVEIETENGELAEWITDHFPSLDNLVIELGEDAIWFPSSYGEIVETRSGGFSHVEPVEPWTILPVTNETGGVVGWRQVTQGERKGDFYQKDELVQFCINKSSARDKTGISEVMRAMDEIQQYRKNQNAISNAVEMAAFPHNHWKVGQDNMSTVTDNELRRVRRIVEDMDSDTQIITGTGVEHDRIEPTKFDFTELTNHDLRKLAIALGVPMDLVSVGEHGLGAGEESKVRMQMFERQARADQRAFTDQFVSEVLDPVLRDYSPFSPEEEEYDIVLGDPIEEDERTDTIDAIGEDLTVNERRALFDKPELEGEEGEQFESPGASDGGDDPMGGLFSGEGGSGNLSLADGDAAGMPEWDSHLLSMHQKLWDAESGTRVLSFTGSETPEFVKARLRDAIMGDAIFSDFENVPGDQLMQLRLFMEEELVESGGWTIDGVADRLQDLDGNLSMEDARTIARTETASVVNTAREEGYEEEGYDDAKFYWTGATKSEQPNRTTSACDWLIQETNPNHGGTPVSLSELKDLIEEAPEHDPKMQDDLARPENFVVHPNERKTFVRHVEG